jgi:archaellum biogenesis protein FlaJ (TadC family)
MKGQISGLLIQLSVDLREENALKEEITASIGMYIMLIFFSAAFGAPALFGISSYIVGVLSSQTAELNITPEQMAEYSAKNPILGLVGISESTITEDFVVLFSMVALFVTCIFASLTLGVISNGKETRGIKYIPVMLAIAFALFFIVRILVQQAFGSMSV